MGTDDIFERHANQGKAKLSLSLLPNESEEEAADPLILIQGPHQALRLLGELLIAIADSEKERHSSASPKSAGSFHFDPASEFGFYINRLDE
ncbi:hypothetical protein [Aminobacter sp. LjRoot7]|uniref:hypothetical protein n=1 Tax=Aminobacter sp. LjRoot7 TaxID=3342335 RepID=UPI003ECDBF70